MIKMHHATLCFLVREDEVLLGMKKRGFGEGKWNGYGGKPEPKDGGLLEVAAVREIYEELGVRIKAGDLEKVGEICFVFDDVPKEKDWNQIVHAFVARRWEGEPRETEEMRPQWFGRNNLPFSDMWVADRYWVPFVLDGKKVKAHITFGKKGAEILKKNISVVNTF